MTIINAIMLSFFMVPGSSLMTPIFQGCHSFLCTAWDTEQVKAIHDCRSRILACAWRDAVQAVPQGTRMGKQGKRFVTVTEAVIFHSVPRWWHREVRRGVAGKDFRVGFPCRQLKNLWHEDPGEVYFSGVDELSIREDGLSVELKGSSLLLPMASLKTRLGSTSLAEAGAFALCITEKSVLVALFCPTTGFRNPQSLVCLDRKSGTLNWTGQLDQHVVGGLGSSGGPTYAYTEIIATDTRIAVFSASQEALSLQCFNAETGEKELTFVSNRVKNHSGE